MAEKPKILIVDDEKDLCEILQFNPETEGFSIDVDHSGEKNDVLTGFHVGDDDVIVTERNADENIARLNKKIGKYGGNIKGKSGYGYCFKNNSIKS